MESKFSYVILTPNTAHHKITQSTFDRLITSSNDSLVQLDDGTFLKTSMCTEVMPIEEYYKQFPEKQAHVYGQPYSYDPKKIEAPRDPTEQAIIQKKIEDIILKLRANMKARMA